MYFIKAAIAPRFLFKHLEMRKLENLDLQSLPEILVSLAPMAATPLNNKAFMGEVKNAEDPSAAAARRRRGGDRGQEMFAASANFEREAVASLEGNVEPLGGPSAAWSSGNGCAGDLGGKCSTDVGLLRTSLPLIGRPLHLAGCLGSTVARAALISAASDAAVPTKTKATPAHISRNPPPELLPLIPLVPAAASAAVKRMDKKR